MISLIALAVSLSAQDCAQFDGVQFEKAQLKTLNALIDNKPTEYNFKEQTARIKSALQEKSNNHCQPLETSACISTCFEVISADGKFEELAIALAPQSNSRGAEARVRREICSPFCRDYRSHFTKTSRNQRPIDRDTRELIKMHQQVK